MKSSVSIVVPVYNSAAILPELLAELDPVLKALGTEFEVILIDDDSTDHSWTVITELKREFSYIRAIRMMRNFGQHNALLCGVRAAKFDVVVTMDDDLQHPPKQIPRLLE